MPVLPPEQNRDRIIVLARKHLSGYLPQTLPVPKYYIDELENHLNLYPDDTNFRVELEPGKGFGKVICLEGGCNAISIPLASRVKTADGGVKDGFGSLSPYRLHIECHPTHKSQRLERLKAEPAVKTEPASSKVLASSNPPSNFASDGNRASSFTAKFDLSPVKSEPSEPKIPKKRVSDAAFPPADTVPEGLEDSPANKKLKQEDIKPTQAATKKPLGQVDSNSIGDMSIAPQPAVPAMSVEQARAEIANVQMLINAEQSIYDRVLRKKKKTKADLTRMGNLARSLAANQRRKEELTAMVPTVPTAAPTSLQTRNPGDVQYRFMPYNGFPTNPYPGNAPNALPYAPDALPNYAPNSIPSYPPNPFPGYSPNPLTGGGANASIPGSSNDIKPVMGQPKIEPVQPECPRLDFQQPVASGSGIKLPSLKVAREWMDPSSDEEMMDADYDPAAEIVRRYQDSIPMMAGIKDSRDENGDFHGRGRDLYVGPQAKADDIEKFLLDAGNAEQFDGNASIDQALVKLGLKNQFQLLPGMTVALMPHQAIGVAWMLEKERGVNQGGILGDEMGLGKTIQMIAVMVKNRSPDPERKTNLILAPLGLLDQWKMEIELKTNADLKVLIYHGSNKPTKKKDLLAYDIILTTYHTMALEWPDIEAEQKARMRKAKRRKSDNNFIESDSDSEYDTPKARKQRKAAGPLLDIDFYRIILDEAQNIRNKRTRTSRACSELNGMYRWGLTGTPIINGLSDVYPYFRFLKFRPWYDWTEFQGHIGSREKRNPSLAVTRLQAILASIMLRRVKTSMLDGKRLIELPEKEVNLVKLQFTHEEREIYEMVERQSQQKFNCYLRAGTVLKNYHHVLVLLLRLRQICSHPSLIQEDGTAFVHPDEIENDKPEVRNELGRARYLVSLDFVTKIKAQFREAALQRLQAEKESADATVEDEECPICFDHFTDAIITPCAHSFCRECILNVINAPVPDDGHNELQANERPCPSCRSPITEEKLFTRAAFEPSDEDLLPEDQRVARSSQGDDPNAVFRTLPKGKGKRKGKKKGRKPVRVTRRSSDIGDACLSGSEISEDDDDDDDDDLSDFIVDDNAEEDEEEKDARLALKKRMAKGKRRMIVLDSDDEMDHGPISQGIIFGAKKDATPPAADGAVALMPRFLPSTKMKAMMEYLRNLAKEHPDEKTLVISQWTTCLGLVSDYLTEAGVGHVKYQGDMSRSMRDQAARAFMRDDTARVMLMSSKCGGVGLNLTRANNVISLDLGWSLAVEAQAFDRCHRLGQSRRVAVQRLVIEDTVEDRVLAMQERKQTLADGSLGEGSGKKIGKLSVRELAALFNLDTNGRLLT